MVLNISNQDNNTKELSNLDSSQETVVAETTGINPSTKGQQIPVIFVEDETRALFKKAKDGKTIFVAGYYILKYDGMGGNTHFVQIETLDKYEHRGLTPQSGI